MIYGALSPCGCFAEQQWKGKEDSNDRLTKRAIMGLKSDTKRQRRIVGTRRHVQQGFQVNDPAHNAFVTPIMDSDLAIRLRK